MNNPTANQAICQSAETPAKTSRGTLYLTEIFSSIQGEGVYVGRRQIFLRLYGCHLNCRFCDTPETVTALQPKGYRPERVRIETTPGAREFEYLANPLGPDILKEWIQTLDRVVGSHHSIAVTGGEPLVQANSLTHILPALKAAGHVVYLETAGDLPTAFDKVAAFVDIVAMDVKLPTASGNPPRWSEHQAFIERCVASDTELFVKVVVDRDTPDDEFQQAVDVVANVDREIPLIIQPVTPLADATAVALPAQLLAWQEDASRRLADVRVTPQTHKFVNQL